MSNRLAMAATLAFVVGLAGLGLASQPATVLLKSGERVSGSFEDIQNHTVYMRLSQDEERRIPLDQVALIDFVGGTRGLPKTELAAARGPEHVLLLKDGASFHGELVDVIRAGEGDRTIKDAAVEMVFRAHDGTMQHVALDRVGRLYFGQLPDLTNIPGAVATTGAPPPAPAPAAPAVPHSTVFGPDQVGWVAANSPWTATGMTVRKGDYVNFTANGEVRIGEGHVATPAGSKLARYAGNSPLPREMMGALIARIDNSAPFAIGDLTGPILMPANGQLYLGVNANPDEMRDNDTGFNVTVRHTPVPARRR